MLKADLRQSEHTLQKLSTDAGAIVQRAIERSGMNRDTAAREMGISASLLNRQMQNSDNCHVSFQRLWAMPQPFKRELVMAMAEEIDGLEVETQIRFRRSA